MHGKVYCASSLQIRSLKEKCISASMHKYICLIFFSNTNTTPSPMLISQFVLKINKNSKKANLDGVAYIMLGAMSLLHIKVIEHITGNYKYTSEYEIEK